MQGAFEGFMALPIVIWLRFKGHGNPVGHPIREKKTSMATPMHISGTTIGNATMPS